MGIATAFDAMQTRSRRIVLPQLYPQWGGEPDHCLIAAAPRTPPAEMSEVGRTPVVVVHLSLGCIQSLCELCQLLLKSTVVGLDPLMFTSFTLEGL